MPSSSPTPGHACNLLSYLTSRSDFSQAIIRLDVGSDYNQNLGGCSAGYPTGHLARYPDEYQKRAFTVFYTEHLDRNPLIASEFGLDIGPQKNQMRFMIFMFLMVLFFENKSRQKLDSPWKNHKIRKSFENNTKKC